MVVAWVPVVRPKAFTPLQVLLFAKSVEEAAVIALLQPKVPLVYESACDALLQAASPAPKKLVVEAMVAKRVVVVAPVAVKFVVVALVVESEVSVALVPVRVVALSAVVVAPVATRLVTLKLVEVALVMVALVPRKEAIVPAVAVKILANRLVEVAWVAVAEVIKSFAKELVPEKVLVSARSVEDAVLSVIQVEFTA